MSVVLFNGSSYDLLLQGHVWAGFMSAMSSFLGGVFFPTLILLLVVGVYLKGRSEYLSLSVLLLLSGLFLPYLSVSALVVLGLVSSFLLARAFFKSFIKTS